jgi:hypothetical protein
MGTNEIAAVDYRRSALFFRLAHSLREGIGAVVTVRDDADLHAPDLSLLARESGSNASYGGISLAAPPPGRKMAS